MDSKKSSNAEIITVDVHAARNLLNSGYLYLDVRTEEEFQNGHVEKAFNVPYMFSTPNGRVKNPNFMDQVLSTQAREDHLVVGCQSGVRSVYAATDLLDAGFKHAYNIGGGYIAWVKSSFEVKKPNLNPPSIPKQQPVKKLTMNPPMGSEQGCKRVDRAICFDRGALITTKKNQPKWCSTLCERYM